MNGGVVVKCLDRFRAKMARTGSSIREDKIKSSKMILDETFYDDASFQADNILRSLQDLRHSAALSLQNRLPLL